MPHLSKMEWDFKDQLQATSKQVVERRHAGNHLLRLRRRRAARAQSDRAAERHSVKDERIYLGGFEIYRSDGAGTADLERETLHIMDDKQRIALVETRTQGDDGSPAQLIRYQFGNHLGSASLELDDQGQIISYEEYFPYGSTSYQAGRSQTETT